MKGGIPVIPALLMLIVAIGIGCEEDKCGTTPEIETYGSIVIDQTPNTLSGAGWALSGPLNRVGSGDIALPYVPIGEYTMTWNDVSGYVRPSTETLILETDGTETFSGAYVEIPGPTPGFAQVTAGTFAMGSPTSERDRGGDEVQHTVTLTTPFEIFATEVTNQQYADLARWAWIQGYCTASGHSVRDALDGSTAKLLDMDELLSEIRFDGGSFTVDTGKGGHPAIMVTWYGAVAYCDWLSLKAGLPRAYDHSTWLCNDNDPYNAAGYRLPTEAEWEYACRAGTQTPFNTGDCLDSETEANYNGNYPYFLCPAGPTSRGTVPVSSYPANDFGLYDMHGNLNEWCNDYYGAYGGDETDPVGPRTESNRVSRGGYWVSHASNCRSANRSNPDPGSSFHSIGFRPTRSTN